MNVEKVALKRLKNTYLDTLILLRLCSKMQLMETSSTLERLRECLVTHTAVEAQFVRNLQRMTISSLNVFLSAAIILVLEDLI